MTFLIIVIVGYVCYSFGVWNTKRIATHAFKKFRDEVHAQYVYLLKKQGIKVSEIEPQKYGTS